jgi:hypothetical protein
LLGECIERLASSADCPETLPFSLNDTTPGSETELQAAVGDAAVFRNPSNSRCRWFCGSNEHAKFRKSGVGVEGKSQNDEEIVTARSRVLFHDKLGMSDPEFPYLHDSLGKAA